MCSLKLITFSILIISAICAKVLQLSPNEKYYFHHYDHKYRVNSFKIGEVVFRFIHSLKATDYAEAKSKMKLKFKNWGFKAKIGTILEFELLKEEKGKAGKVPEIALVKNSKTDSGKGKNEDYQFVHYQNCLNKTIFFRAKK